MQAALDWVKTITQALVDNPDQVQVNWDESPEGAEVKITISKEDRPKLIGKQGRNIKALRSLTQMAFSTDDKKVGVEIVE